MTHCLHLPEMARVAIVEQKVKIKRTFCVQARSRGKKFGYRSKDERTLLL
jgi:hypothetical protein